MRCRAVILLAALALLCPAAASASSYSEANDAYRHGDYVAAAKLYEGEVTRGVEHEDLFYNLGNAYFRSGRLGPAIYNYERALRIDPGLEDAEYNLAIARDAVSERAVDRLEGADQQPTWVRVATFFSISELTLGFLIFDFLLFGALIALRFLATGFARTAIAVLAAFLALAFVSSGVLLRAQLYVLEEVHQGIVLPDQVTMREGPDASLAERGQLHPGVKVTVLGEETGWLLVRLANGVEGWVPSQSIGRL